MAIADKDSGYFQYHAPTAFQLSQHKLSGRPAFPQHDGNGYSSAWFSAIHPDQFLVFQEWEEYQQECGLSCLAGQCALSSPPAQGNCSVHNFWLSWSSSGCPGVPGPGVPLGVLEFSGCPGVPFPGVLLGCWSSSFLGVLEFFLHRYST